MARAPDADTQRQLRPLLRRLQAALQPERVILFGSRARGDHLLHSDIDLIVVARAFEGVPWRERLLRVLELHEGELALEPLCYTPEEFERKRTQIGIVQEALREGVEVTSS